MGAQKFLRLRDEFRASLPWKRGDGQAFVRWGRRRPEIAVIDRRWLRALREGDPVPDLYVHWLAEYLSEKFGEKFSLKDMAEECDLPGGGGPILTFYAGWFKLLEFFSDLGSMPDESYCGKQDVPFAARCIMEVIGMTGTQDPAHAMETASKVMGISFEDYIDYLDMVRRKDERLLMFPVWKHGKERVRVATTMVIPLTEAFNSGYRAGRFEPLDTTEDDIVVPSKYLMLGAFAEVRDLGFNAAVGRASRSVATVSTFLWQLASLCPPLHTINPRLISLLPSEEEGKRLRAHNFVPTGAHTPKSMKPIVEFVPPKFGSSASDIGHYAAMKATLTIFQAMTLGQSLFED